MRNDGEGELLIGGEERRCVVDGRLECEWTRTGDVVEKAADGVQWKISGRTSQMVRVLF